MIDKQKLVEKLEDYSDYISDFRDKLLASDDLSDYSNGWYVGTYDCLKYILGFIYNGDFDVKG